jgi:hypothetical protein
VIKTRDGTSIALVAFPCETARKMMSIPKGKNGGQLENAAR